MSLSKVFKDSRLFQPEEILPRPENSGFRQSGSRLSDRSFRESPVGRTTSPSQGFTLDQQVTPPQHPLQIQSSIEPVQESTSTDSPAPTDDQENLPEPEEEEIQGIDPFTVEKLVEESFHRGIAEGLKRSENDFGSALQALLALCRQLDTLRETILTNSIEEMQDLVLAIAEKIVRVSVRDQDTTIIETVDQAIHSAVRSDEFYIYVHPEDFAVIQEKSPDFIAGLNGLNNLVIKKDPAIERGGCKVESENCTVDATIASQFEIIREQVKKRLTQA